MSEKIPITLYKIKDSLEFDEIVEQIENNGYHRQEVQFSHSSFELVLLYSHTTPRVKWKDFFQAFVRYGEDILENQRTMTESYVFLMRSIATESVYCATGGNGFFEVQDNIDCDFGISVISRLIKKDEKILKATKETKLSGGTYGETKYFRSSLNLYENENFGTFYQEVKTLLDRRILNEKLGFGDEDLKRDSLCIAKNSFKITKSLSLNDLLNVIEGCEEIISTIEPIEINRVKKLNRSSEKDLIKSLKSFLVYKLWKRYKESEDSYNFDLCHSEYEKYLTADSYRVFYRNYQNEYLENCTFDNLIYIDDLFTRMREPRINIPSIKKFSSILGDLKIQSFDENSSILTRGTFKSHIFADITFRSKRYFYMNDDFYVISDKFIQELNESCNSFINKNYHILQLHSWDSSLIDENEYNQKYLGNRNCLVLDKITPENIEFCDFLRWDNKRIYLYHVKKAFGNTMRDLCSQIYISANRYQQSKSDYYRFHRTVYKELSNKIGGNKYFDSVGRQTDNITEEEFISLFREREPEYVLLVRDVSTKKRTIKDMKKFNSNIAKFSLNELIKNMTKIGMYFSIAEILSDTT